MHYIRIIVLAPFVMQEEGAGETSKPKWATFGSLGRSARSASAAAREAVLAAPRQASVAVRAAAASGGATLPQEERLCGKRPRWDGPNNFPLEFTNARLPCLPLGGMDTNAPASATASGGAVTQPREALRLVRWDVSPVGEAQPSPTGVAVGEAQPSPAGAAGAMDDYGEAQQSPTGALGMDARVAAACAAAGAAGAMDDYTRAAAGEAQQSPTGALGMDARVAAACAAACAACAPEARRSVRPKSKRLPAAACAREARRHARREPPRLPAMAPVIFKREEDQTLREEDYYYYSIENRITRGAQTPDSPPLTGGHT